MKTGVYRILNKLDGKCYVGSAAVEFRKRWNKHRSSLRNKTHHSCHLQHAWDKYGESSFVFEVLEECSPTQCIEREQYYLDTILFASCNDKRFSQLGYNICRIAGSALGRKHTEATKQKMRDLNQGKVITQETRLKIGKANRGNIHSLITKQKISKANRGENAYHSKLKECEVRYIWRRIQNQEKIIDIARNHNVSRSTISDIKHGRSWKWI